MLKSEAQTIVGRLSAPSKMPCPAWSISAKRCKTGSKLAKIPGTVCHDCYALRGRYGFPNVQEAQERRYRALSDPRWVEAMAKLIEGQAYFRWFDSGDIQDEEHWQKILEVCRRTPETKHWLPTKERVYWKRPVPSNLLVRYSAAMVDGKAPEGGPCSISVSDGSETCPAETQGNKCLDCRACWDKDVRVVKYKHKRNRPCELKI
jgi:hypothetical protein